MQEELVEIRKVAASVDAQTGPVAERQKEFQELKEGYLRSKKEKDRARAALMKRWEPGLFVGEEEVEKRAEQGEKVSPMPEDNYDLERWFRLPKRHARKIHGRSHTGISLVQNGATRMLTLDAHEHHPKGFTGEELRPYRKVEVPPEQKEALHRGKVMRRGRSVRNRHELLAELEARHRSVV